jgi:transcription antitermination factor NusG
MMSIDTMSPATPDRQNGLFWVAIQTRHRHEKRISQRLQGAELETFLPVHRAVHRWKNGVNAHVELPLFPCYLFARVRPADRLRVLREPGVISIAASSLSPTPIADEEIARLRMAADSVKAQPHPYLAVGERVRVARGPLAGLEGILVRKKQELRVVVSIEVIMRSITVEVSEFEIEPVRGDRLQYEAKWVVA